jgi:proteasome accessory factor C
LGEERGVAEILISERIAWQIERHFGRYGQIRVPGEAIDAGDKDDDVEEDLDRDVDAVEADRGDRVLLTGYSSPRGIVSWVLGLGAHARSAI